MNRILGFKLLPVVACLSLVAGRVPARPDDAPVKKELAELQGCWKLVSFELNGETRDPIGGGEPRWFVKGDKVHYGGEEVIQFTADPTTTPRIIDLKFRGPDRVYEGIYDFEKDTLKICLNGRADTKDRPEKFATKDQPDRRLLVFEREKAAPANPTEGLTPFAGVQLRFDADMKAIVVDVPIKGSPAEKAGMKKGDVILSVGTTAVTELEATVKAVRQAKVGAKLEFQIKRDGKDMTVTVTVGVLPFQYTTLLD
jgi:uncharacterized protein (TIGR03067 family)